MSGNSNAPIFRSETRWPEAESVISNDSWGSFGESFILRICSGPARDQKFRGKFWVNIKNMSEEIVLRLL